MNGVFRCYKCGSPPFVDDHRHCFVISCCGQGASGTSEARAVEEWNSRQYRALYARAHPEADATETLALELCNAVLRHKKWPEVTSFEQIKFHSSAPAKSRAYWRAIAEYVQAKKPSVDVEKLALELRNIIEGETRTTLPVYDADRWRSAAEWAIKKFNGVGK